MDISINYAQEIVSEIGDIIKKNINLMDETGHIIASTDPDRIGDIHEGARDIVREGWKNYIFLRNRPRKGRVRD